MAMITCSECGRAVSNKAAACIGCGAPLSALPDVNWAPKPNASPPPTRQQIRRRAMWAVSALVIGVVCANVVDHRPGIGRLGALVAALLIIGGLCGIIVSLVHAMSSRP